MLEINTHTIDWDSAAQKIYRFELRNHNYFITKPEEGYSTKRGILLLYKKSLGMTINNITQVNFNLLRMELEHPELKLIIYGVYADSDMDNPEFFLEVRKLTLEDNCSNILITGDFNTTLCPVKDRWNYTSDNHKKSRAVIQNWIDEGEYVDGHRAFFPDNEKLFTYRKPENDRIIKQSRDYSLSSVDLFNLIKRWRWYQFLSHLVTITALKLQSE